MRAKTKVKEIVLYTLAQGWAPETIAEELSHLSLAQIHAAFAYYDGHQAEVDADIAADETEVVRIRQECEPQQRALLALLRARGALV